MQSSSDDLRSGVVGGEKNNQNKHFAQRERCEV